LRSGLWGDVAEITGIECVGVVRHDPNGEFAAGQKVVALVGGMGRNLNGSYAEWVNAPVSNVAPIRSELPWAHLAAMPESYATAWTALVGILSLKPGQKVLVRGATSALGQAAINIAVQEGAYVVATTRSPARFELLRNLGAQEVLIDDSELSQRLSGLDAALDIVGNATVLDSLACVRRGGSVCQVGFLGGDGPLTLEPVFQIPSGRHLVTFASAMVTGGAEFPLSEIPFQAIADRMAAGVYKAEPTEVFKFDQIQDAHRLLESGKAGGKLVVVV
jgi:NADPH:quinone reductase-like Zn-dependent oxidoreductase